MEKVTLTFELVLPPLATAAEVVQPHWTVQSMKPVDGRASVWFQSGLSHHFVCCLCRDLLAAAHA